MPDNPISSTPPFADFDAAAKGATFRRVDLHIHSFGVSKDVKDSSMVPAAIVAKAIERGIDMLAVTDHNAIDAVESAIAEGAKQGVTVIAGVELSTAEGHLLAYFDPSDLKGFKKWFGRLEFKEDGQDRVILAPMHQIVSDIDKAGGIAIPAHVARSKSGCLDIAPVKSLEELIESRAVAALEIDGPSEFNFFSNDDNSDGSSVRKAQLRKRIKALGEIDGTRLPKVYFSDAHELEQIGRNRDGDERLTRVKMSTPSFDALRQAILDPDARIRLEEQLPQTYPQIIGARMIGGFLDGQEIAFSPNLTCLIGGRGAGKSTALEAMRSACLSASHDRDASAGSGWPETVQLIYQDAFGELHYLERTSGSATIERVGSEAVPTSIEVEGYDQDSVAEIIRGYRDKPDLLGDFLDQFADLSSVQKLLSELRQEIEEHAEAIAPLADATQRKKTAQQALAEATAKLKVIETTKLKTALEYRRLLAKERTLRESMVDRLRKLSTDIDGLDTKVDVSTLLSDAGIPDIDDTPSKDLLGGTGDDAGLISAVDQLDAAMTTWRTEGEEAFKEAMKEIKPSLEKWNDYERRVEERINAIADDLRAKGVNPNMSELTRLTNVEAQSAIAIKEADADLVKERKLRTAREDLLKSFKQQQAARFYLRREATKRLTTLLNKSLRKFKVKISFRQAARVDLYEEWLRATMAARVFRGPRATAFCREIGPSALASALRKKQFEVLTTIEDDKGNKFFSKRSEAEDFAALVSPEALNELETIEVSDLPEITLTETVARKPRSIDFENLSFGQQASILLGMLLFAENVEPLIIDQPEDHLDSAFISETVVATLRQVKERRQVILATHNANIAVLGDAELIVPMQGFAGKGVIRDSGSVDSTATSARACEILEGGESAFLRRGQMYGLPRS